MDFFVIIVTAFVSFFVGVAFSNYRMVTRISEEIIDASMKVMLVNFFEYEGERFFYEKFTGVYLGKCKDDSNEEIHSIINLKFPNVKEVIFLEKN